MKLRGRNKNKHKSMKDLEILYYGCVMREKYATFNKGTCIKMAAV